MESLSFALITGGSGFIGSNLINYLIKKNYKICNIDKLSEVSTPEKFKVLRNKKNYKFYKANLLNINTVKKIFSSLIINNLNSFSIQTDKMKKQKNGNHIGSCLNRLISSYFIFRMKK